MTSATVRSVFGWLILPLFALVFIPAPRLVQAQDVAYGEYYAPYSSEELAQMLAPIALYPDALLAQILMASTYPIEVVEADRFVRANPGLRDAALDNVLLSKDWDPSVKALSHFPSILALMSERIAETTELGNAFLAQEADVMAMVQQLRAQAHAQGHLASNAQQQVIVEKETIIIQPANPRVVYVPYYNPYYVYGSWWYPAYPPYYWGPPDVRISYGISYWPGFYFSFSFGSWSYVDWHRHVIYLDVHTRPRFVRHDRWIVSPQPWRHAPAHRRGVAYRDSYTARKYTATHYRTTDVRRDGRGSSDYRQRELDRRITSRGPQDANQRSNVRSGIERSRQQQQHIERDRQHQQVERSRQERGQVERNRQQPQAERARQERDQVERNRQQAQRVERERREQQVERSRQEQAQSERNRQKAQRIERERTNRSQIEGQRQQPGRTENRQQVVPPERRQPQQQVVRQQPQTQRAAPEQHLRRQPEQGQRPQGQVVRPPQNQSRDTAGRQTVENTRTRSSDERMSGNRQPAAQERGRSGSSDRESRGDWSRGR